MRKRELTVEKWAKDMERNRKLMDGMGKVEFLMKHAERIEHGNLVYGLVDVMYEMQMAEAWVGAGMQVYEFDRDFSDSIVNEKWVDLLPDVIGNRPYDCFYMKLPFNSTSEGAVVRVVNSENIIGFNPSLFPNCEEKGVHFGGDPRYAKGENSRIVVNTGDEILAICHYAIPVKHEYMLDDTQLGLYPIQLVANGTAYLCSVNADIEPVYKPVNPGGKKRRSAATWSSVGYRIGAELRSYTRYVSERSEHKGGTVRPHMRRAHWHRFWTGPRKGERKLELRWVAPTMVNVGKFESATGHRVVGERAPSKL